MDDKYFEDGDICPECGDGRLCFNIVNCTCFISAPCAECESSPLKCNKCGFETRMD